jgi:hypothetical protein
MGIGGPQDAMAKKAKDKVGPAVSVTKLHNILMQMRKNCNHPDLITAGFDGSVTYPGADELVAECGKLRLLDRLLTRLHAAGHKVLIFSQVLLSTKHYMLNVCLDLGETLLLSRATFVYDCVPLAWAYWGTGVFVVQLWQSLGLYK